MTGGSRIISLGGGAVEADNAAETAAIDTAAPASVEEEAADDDFAPANRWRWLVPAVAGLLIAGWTTLFVAAKLPVLRAGPDPLAAVDLVGVWALPVLVVLAGVLIARTTLRDASRHAAVIHALAQETRTLDARLRSMNTELSLARDFIAAQGRDLESLGRVAVDRLTGSADRLKDVISGQSQAVDHIANVAATALDNVEMLRGHLPVISNSAKDVANAIAHAGRTAEGHLENLIGGFNRLNEFGTASGRKVDEVRQQVGAALDAFAVAAERIGVAGETRLAQVIAQLEAQRARIDREEVAALAAIRARSDALAAELAGQAEVMARAEEDSLSSLATRIAALDTDVRRVAAELAQSIEEVGRDHDGLLAASRQRLHHFEESAAALNRTLLDEAGRVDDAIAERRHALEAALAAAAERFAERLSELDAAIGQRRASMAAAAADAAAALDVRLGAIDSAIDSQRKRQLDAIEHLAATCDVLSERVAAFATTIEQANGEGQRTASAVDAALNILTDRLNAARTALGGTDATVAELTDAAVRLLELIEASAEHTRTQLPEALRSASAGLDGMETRVVGLRDTLREAGDSGHALAADLDASGLRLADLLGEFGTGHARITKQATEQARQIDKLRETLRAAQGESDTLAGSIERRLAGAIAELEAAAHKAGSDIGMTTAAEIEALAARLGDQTSAALARVVQGRGAQLIARLEEAIDAAAGSARDTAVQLRDQLAKIDELAGNLESRVARARELAEERIDSDFARRTAIITESLNSTAIDISRILSAEVSETAWASYLRGERGIFTRRAVSLLDANEARTVQAHYENDEEFRSHVNRYIHDFEAMLRQLLSTRDGNALGVTLLSSDMGKLYVALAQGIERLRA